MAKKDWRSKVKALASKNVAYVRLSEDEWDHLHRTRSAGTRFSLIFPHEVARKAKADSLALFAINDAELRVGIVSSVQTVATMDSRVLFDLVQPVVPGVLDELVSQLAAMSTRLPTKRLLEGDERLSALSEKLRDKIFEQLTGEPANEIVFSRILARIDRPRRFDGVRALQADAIAVALKAFGVTDGASAVSFVGKDSSIEGARLLEDAVIEHDARWAPGWKLDDSDVTGKAVFTQRSDRLVVYTANKRPLEELLGVDLIYLNEQRGSLVMVQYKMMESTKVVDSDYGERIGDEDDGLDEPAHGELKEWVTPIDAQFKEEMKRMARFKGDLSPGGCYRLNPGAFYFKLVRRNAATNSPTLVLSLGHLNKMLKDGEMSGPRGGLRISYGALGGHYLRGDGFIELIRSGYIGTRDATTVHLRILIDEALNNRRGVVAAIQSAIGLA